MTLAFAFKVTRVYLQRGPLRYALGFPSTREGQASIWVAQATSHFPDLNIYYFSWFSRYQERAALVPEGKDAMEIQRI